MIAVLAKFFRSLLKLGHGSFTTEFYKKAEQDDVLISTSVII